MTEADCWDPSVPAANELASTPMASSGGLVALFMEGEGFISGLGGCKC